MFIKSQNWRTVGGTMINYVAMGGVGVSNALAQIVSIAQKMGYAEDQIKGAINDPLIVPSNINFLCRTIFVAH